MTATTTSNSTMANNRAEAAYAIQHAAALTSSPTYHEHASSFALWQEYVDPDATMSEAEFDAMGYESRMKLLVEMYGLEDDEQAA